MMGLSIPMYKHLVGNQLHKWIVVSARPACQKVLAILTVLSFDNVFVCVCVPTEVCCWQFSLGCLSRTAKRTNIYFTFIGCSTGCSLPGYHGLFIMACLSWPVYRGLFIMAYLSWPVYHGLFIVACLSQPVYHGLFIMACLSQPVYHGLFIMACLSWPVYHGLFIVAC